MSEPFDPSRGFRSADQPPTTNPFLPILIMGLVMAAWFGFQVVQLRGERDAFRDTLASQDKQVQNSAKLRDSLDAIARGTAQLAEAGNPNARLVVDDLKKRGVTIVSNQRASGIEAAAVPTK